MIKMFLRWIKQFLECPTKMQSLRTENFELEQSFKEAQKTIIAQRAEIDRLEGEIAKLKEQLPKEDPMEKYWNEKYPKAFIVYKGRYIPNVGFVEVDVRNFITPYDDSIPRVHGKNDDEIMLRALEWVMNNITYTSDKKQEGLYEYWQFPFETLKTRKGDCEDGAILLYNIALKSGVPYWRMRLNAGYVKGGGHAYLTYCRLKDNQFVVMDWCYWPNRLHPSERPLHKDERNYYEVWFSWNKKYAFHKPATETGEDVLPVVIKRDLQYT